MEHTTNNKEKENHLDELLVSNLLVREDVQEENVQWLTLGQSGLLKKG